MNSADSPLTGQPELSVVLPALNEAGNIEPLYRSLVPVLEQLGVQFELIFVDDGSSDGTFEQISSLASEDLRVSGLRLSRNFGHQRAICAGLAEARGRAVLTMDTDLQHPPSVIPEMYARLQAGAEVIVAVPEDQSTLSHFKRTSAQLFYWLLNQIADSSGIQPGGEFRLLSRRACDEFLRLSERTRFNRGLFQWIGLSQARVTYRVGTRHSGESKYTLSQMISLAADGIFSFSSRPLRIFLYAGVASIVLSLLYGSYAIAVYLQARTVPGWTSLLLTVMFLGGLQLLGIGILGEYVGRIFHEVKGRPLYVVEERIRGGGHGK